LGFSSLITIGIHVLKLESKRLFKGKPFFAPGYSGKI
jgi:hypothetical protein